MRTQTLRLAVLSYLTIVLLLWMARILAVSGLISLPFGFSALGAQANLVTGGLFLALGPGILGMRVLNRRQRVESRKVTRHEITFRWGGRCFLCKECGNIVVEKL